MGRANACGGFVAVDMVLCVICRFVVVVVLVVV